MEPLLVASKFRCDLGAARGPYSHLCGSEMYPVLCKKMLPHVEHLCGALGGSDESPTSTRLSDVSMATSASRSPLVAAASGPADASGAKEHGFTPMRMAILEILCGLQHAPRYVTAAHAGGAAATERLKQLRIPGEDSPGHLDTASQLGV
jgi:hypothetical protein